MYKADYHEEYWLRTYEDFPGLRIAAASLNWTKMELEAGRLVSCIPAFVVSHKCVPLFVIHKTMKQVEGISTLPLNTFSLKDRCRECGWIFNLVPLLTTYGHRNRCDNSSRDKEFPQS
jgi:hypothetical protein